MKGPESRKKYFNDENLCHCENTPFMHIQIRENISKWAHRCGFRDITRRQFIKNSMGKLFFLPSGLTTKNNDFRLWERFDCEKTQICTILKQKNSLLSMYKSSALGSRVRTNKTSRVSEYEEINKSLYEWYTLF